MSVTSLEVETRPLIVRDTVFQLDTKYSNVEPLCHGAFGVACAAHDTKTTVIVRKIEGFFDHIVSTKRTLRELRILRHLVHENLLQVRDIYIDGTRNDFKEIYLVSDFMETDLAAALASDQAISNDHIQFFLYQLLRGIKYVHSAQVIHRDLKPRSLLLNSDCELKICNFSISRLCCSNRLWVCPMTEYVCTRWYRAPEVLCSWTDYSTSIDVWSIGCIFAEMFLRRTLFQGGNAQEQLDLIIGLLGTPKPHELMKIPNEKCRKFVKSLPQKTGTDFQQGFMDIPQEALGLMALMLRWDPDTRIPVHEAIQHSYLGELHVAEDEPVSEPLDASDFEFERRKVTSDALREELFHEMLFYHPDLLRQFQAERQGLGDSYDIQQCRLLLPGEMEEDEAGETDDDGDY